MIASLYRYRSFIMRSACLAELPEADVKTWTELRDRYAGSGIGVFWNILVPLIQIAIYIFIFSAILGARAVAGGSSLPPRFAFVLFLCTGMLPWLSFADSISRGTQSLVRNASYLQKMALPEAIFCIDDNLALGRFAATLEKLGFTYYGIGC